MKLKEKIEEADTMILENLLENNYDLNVQFHQLMRECIYSFATANYDETIPFKEWQEKYYGKCIEEPNQETLEEAYKRIKKELSYSEFDYTSFKLGVKWQEQNSDKKYSIIEIESLVRKIQDEVRCDYSDIDIIESNIEKAFEQFKKK